jgi:hypothetical protein
MRAAFKTLLCVGMVFAAVMIVRAEDDKKAESKTLKGEIGCPKCVFKLDKKITGGKCGNAIKVKDGDKEVIYIFQDKGAKESYHKTICAAAKAGSVKGVVSKNKKTDQDQIKPDKDSVKFED